MPIVLQKPEEQDGTMGNALSGASNSSLQPQQQVQAQGPQQSTQSAVIGSDQPQMGSTPAPMKAAQPKTGTGFTNIQKYIQANQGAGARMAGSLGSQAQTQASQIKSQIESQKQQLATQVGLGQQRMQQAGQFGQQAIQRAGRAVDVTDLQKQQEDLSTRLKAIGPIQAQDYVKRQEEIKAQQLKTQQDLSKATADREAFLRDFGKNQDTVKALRDKYTFTTMTGKNDNIPVTKFDLDALRENEADFNKYYTAEQYLKSQEPRRTQLEQAVAQAQAATGTPGVDLEALQFQQKQAERAKGLESELAGIKAKLATNQPLSEEEVTRFKDITSGRETFDQVKYDDSATMRKAETLQKLAGLTKSEAGRRELLRQQFGGGSQGYTRGQSALDQLLLQSDEGATENLIQQAKTAGKESISAAQQARRKALEDIAGLTTGGAALRESLGKGLTGEKSKLVGELEARLKTGEGSQIAKLKKAMDAGLLSKAQAEQLGISEGKTYGADLKTLLGDITKGQTRESVGSLSDLARASQIARLAGNIDQDVFANRDIVGQLSAQQKMKIGDIQAGIEEAKSKQQAAEQSLSSKIGKTMGAGALESGPESYIRTNTENVVNALSGLMQSGKEPQTRQQLTDAVNTALNKAGAGHAAWGLGNFSKLASQEYDQALMNQANLQKRIGVEADKSSLAGTAPQSAMDKYNARKQILDILSKATTQYGSDADRRRITSNEGLIDAYERITGRKLK